MRSRLDGRITSSFVFSCVSRKIILYYSTYKLWNVGVVGSLLDSALMQHILNLSTHKRMKGKVNLVAI